MWREFFPNATIYGVDIVDKSMFLSDEKIKTITYDATKKDIIDKFLKGIEFDIIIDDGSHIMKDQQVSFSNLFPLVKPGGFYCIEDIHTSLSVKNNVRWGVNPDRSNSTYNMFKTYEKTSKIKSEYLTESELVYLNNNIESFELYVGKRGKKGSLTSAIKKK